MKTIWKYQLDAVGKQRVYMKQKAEILAVQVQDGNPCIWALVDPEQSSIQRTLRIYGTGQPIEDDPGRYIGTFQFDGGSLVFHVFEVAS